MWGQVQKLRDQATPGNKLSELKVIEVVERATGAWRPEGEWISRLDLVHEGDRLVAKRMPQLGRCNEQCKTIELAAQRIVGNDDTDIAEVLFSGSKDVAEFKRWLCDDLTDSCARDPPPVPKSRVPGPPFQPRPEGEKNVDKILGEIEDFGFGVTPKARDELLEKARLDQLVASMESGGAGSMEHMVASMRAQAGAGASSDGE